MPPETVLTLRQKIQRTILDRQFEAKEDPLALKKRQPVRELYEAYFAEYQLTRGERRSPRTLETYREIWDLYLLPIEVEVAQTRRPLGTARIDQVTPDTVAKVRDQIVEQVLARRSSAKNGGRTTANRALQQAQAAWEFAYRNGWVTANPWSARTVYRFEEAPDDHVLGHEDYAALGEALREAEEWLLRTRPPLSYRTIVGLRLLLLTGARMQEILQATLNRSAAAGKLLPYLERSPYPRIIVQRAKGDRGAMKRPAGRTIWLPSCALTLIDRIDRPVDATDWLLPGDVPGQPIQRLNKAWRWLLNRAGVAYVPPKTCRTSYRTLGPDAAVPREHMQLLLGHSGAQVTDVVYLKEMAPSLSAAAEKMAGYIRTLMGEPEAAAG
jgi:integrase